VVSTLVGTGADGTAGTPISPPRAAIHKKGDAMPTRTTTRTTLVTGLALAGTAHAVTLATAPMVLESPDTLNCTIVNVGGKDVEVTVTAVLRESGADTIGPVDLEPGAMLANALVSGIGQPELGYCRFEVKGGKKRVRAAACRQPGDACAAALPAF
jgi:hypothetical protein